MDFIFMLTLDFIFIFFLLFFFSFNFLSYTFVNVDIQTKRQNWNKSFLSLEYTRVHTYARTHARISTFPCDFICSFWFLFETRKNSMMAKTLGKLIIPIILECIHVSSILCVVYWKTFGICCYPIKIIIKESRTLR